MKRSIKKSFFIVGLCLLCVSLIVNIKIVGETFYIKAQNSADVIGVISGPNDVRPNDLITVTYSVSGSSLLGVSGTIFYDYNKLTYVSSANLISGSWNVTFNATASQGVKFIAIDNSQQNPINTEVSLISVTFRVNSSMLGGMPIAVTAFDVSASAGSGAISIQNVTYKASVIGEVLYGDVNADYSVNPIDGTIFVRHMALWSNYEVLANSLAADLNDDGYINPIDATILARHLGKWETYLVLPRR